MFYELLLFGCCLMAFSSWYNWTKLVKGICLFSVIKISHSRHCNFFTITWKRKCNYLRRGGGGKSISCLQNLYLLLFFNDFFLSSFIICLMQVSGSEWAYAFFCAEGLLLPASGTLGSSKKQVSQLFSAKGLGNFYLHVNPHGSLLFWLFLFHP